MLSEKEIREYKVTLGNLLRDRHDGRMEALDLREYDQLEGLNNEFEKIAAQIDSVNHILEEG